MQPWTKIDGYENYQVSQCGMIQNFKSKKILKPYINNKGYECVNLYGNDTRKHKFVSVLVARTFIPNPDNKPFVDHIDGDIRNNHVSNLRWATNSENQHNSSRRSDNTSGFKGVSWFKRDNKWRAQIMKDSKRQHLGYFDSAQEAADAYDLAAIEMFGVFARLNKPKPIAKIPITITLKTPSIDLEI